MKNLIIHYHCVKAEYELTRTGLYDHDIRRKRAYVGAYKTIQNLLNKHPNTPQVNSFIPEEDPILKRFKPDDIVILYGTMRSGCVDKVARKLVEKGVKVAYSIDGTID